MVESNKYNNPCEMTNNPGQQVSPWTEIINGPNGKVVMLSFVLRLLLVLDWPWAMRQL
jgi:hypothetical protein